MHIVPVYDDFALPHLTRRIDIAGLDVTRYLIKLMLMLRYVLYYPLMGYSRASLRPASSYDLDMDTRLAEETTTTLVDSYTLPDGRPIKVSSERFEAPECMSQPHLVDIEQPGIAEMLFETIQSAAVGVRAELYKHIVVSGGSSMCPSLPSRLEKEWRTVPHARAQSRPLASE
ncbi:hypothetical protein BGW80DRAFT_453646 [Lactifluus volemus]|nr:hypothetical protein BGW80DRAFT_453646 [Lactifluus volemus]